jgi:hypothetical protein
MRSYGFDPVDGARGRMTNWIAETADEEQSLLLLRPLAPAAATEENADTWSPSLTTRSFSLPCSRARPGSKRCEVGHPPVRIQGAGQRRVGGSGDLPAVPHPVSSISVSVVLRPPAVVELLSRARWARA